MEGGKGRKNDCLMTKSEREGRGRRKRRKRKKKEKRKGKKKEDKSRECSGGQMFNNLFIEVKALVYI